MLKQLFLLITILIAAQFSASAQSPCEPKPPAPVCEETVVVNLSDNEDAKVFADSFDNGSISFTCGDETLTFSVARHDECDGNCEDGDLGPSITASTTDIGNPFNVVMRVTDALGISNDCMTIVKVVDKVSDTENDNNGGNNSGCTLACLDNLTASVSSNGTINIWPLDFLESICSGKVKLTIQDTDQNVIFEQTTENYWTATTDDIDKPYVYTITHAATNNSCWGNVLIIDKIGDTGTETTTEGEIEGPDAEDHKCPDFAIDFSSYELEEKVEFDNVSLAAVNSQLSSTYAKAFDDMIWANGIDPASNEYLVAYNIEDAIFDLDNGDIKIVRTITLVDWCNFNPANGNNGIKEVTQVIVISNLSSMVVADINYAEGSTSIAVNEIFLKNQNGQVAMPALSSDESLSSSISKTLETAKWEQGNYDIEVDKYDACANGVSSIDIVLVMRHILGLKLLESNAKIVAADFDENGSVSAADLVSMRKTVLGISDCNGDSNWRFLKKSLNDANSFELGQLPNHELSYAINQDDNNDINIIAIKKGDVNLSAVDKKSIKSKKTQMSTEDIALVAGHEYELAFTATENMEFVSGDLDFELSRDFEVIGFSSDALNIEDHHYHIGDTKAKLVWYGEESATLNENDNVFTMHIRSNVNGNLSDILSPSMTDIEMYVSIDSKKSVRSQISFSENQDVQGNVVSSYNIYMDNDQLNITSKENSGVLIKAVEVFNMTGQRVYTNMNVEQPELVATIKDHRTEILTYRVLSQNGTLQVGKVFSY